MLRAPVERVWELVLRTDTLRYVAGPVMVFRPPGEEDLPSVWRPGKTAELRLFLLGLLPLGPHRIAIVEADHARKEIHSRESGRVAPVWTPDEVAAPVPTLKNPSSRLHARFMGSVPTF